MPIVIFLTFLILLPLASASAQSFHSDKSVTRELWVGHFNQTSPMPWSGQMQLFLRYQSSSGPVSGVITWPGLGGSRSEISGVRSGNTVTFTEDKCLENCGQTLMGGTYQGTFDDQYRSLTGLSSLKPLGLKGNFKLQRLMLPD